MARIVHTLAIVHQPPRVLLGRKKRGFGAGKWNGFGGKVRSGECLADAARRELREEAGIAARTMESAGMLEFIYSGELVHEVHLFRVTDFEGEAGESEETIPC
jgi:8-oxo-dGTP diphosphatase/2-hydroxy-dATP diphosphatase